LRFWKGETEALKVSESNDFRTSRSSVTGGVLVLILGIIIKGSIGGRVLGAADGILIDK
jgi:hypothetical protein